MTGKNNGKTGKVLIEIVEDDTVKKREINDVTDVLWNQPVAEYLQIVREGGYDIYPVESLVSLVFDESRRG